MTTMRESFKRHISSYNHNDSFNLVSAVRAKYGDVAIEELLESIQDFIEQEIKLAVEKEREEIRNEVRGMEFVDPSEAGQFRMHADGYNQAVEEIAELIKNRA